MATKEEMKAMILAVKRGLIAPDRVQECLDLEAQELARGTNGDGKGDGKPRGLLQIVVAKRYLSREQIRQLLRGGHRTVTLDQARQLPGYTIVKKIGEGGMGSVFEGIVHGPIERPCAIKILFPDRTRLFANVQRFRQEAELLISFDHPNLVKGYEFGVFIPTEDPRVEGMISPATLDSLLGPPSGVLPGMGSDSVEDLYNDGDDSEPLYFFSMEMVRGETLLHLLEQRGRFPERIALTFTLQIAHCLQYLERYDIVHRDIKPANILVDMPSKQAKLCDLGFAYEMEPGMEGKTSDTTLGTPQYISPEQARGRADLDIRSDIYALGCTLYHLLVGEVPFTGKDQREIIEKQVFAALETRKLKELGVAVEVRFLIERMMAKNRDMRYQTPGEVIDDIKSMLKVLR